jgi:hypothetical protein
MNEHHKLMLANEAFQQATTVWLKAAETLFDTGLSTCIEETQSLMRVVDSSKKEKELHLKSAQSWDDFHKVENQVFETYALCDARRTTKLEFVRHQRQTMVNVAHRELLNIVNTEQKILGICLKEDIKHQTPTWKLAYLYMEFVFAKQKLQKATTMYLEHAKVGENIILDDIISAPEVSNFIVAIKIYSQRYIQALDEANRKLRYFNEFVIRNYSQEEEEYIV